MWHRQDLGILREFEGHYLIHEPSVPVYEPITQPPSATTEDMLLEEGIALSALGEPCKSLCASFNVMMISETAWYNDLQFFYNTNMDLWV